MARAGTPAGRTGVALLALSLPLAVTGAVPGAAVLRLPSVADVRSSTVRLLDWVTDTHPAAPETPVQRSGSASAHPGQVPAAVTSAVGRAAGSPPGKGRGQAPGFQYHAPSAQKFVTGPADAGRTASFSPATSKLVASATTATSDLYQNADGSYTRHVYGPR